MEYQDPVEITCHLICDKTDNKITKVLESWSQNTSERIINDKDKTCIPRRNTENYWWPDINMKVW